jgi:ribosome maturation factor RimP
VEALRDKLLPLIEPLVAGLGYELVDLEYLSQGLLRIYIDRAQGIDVDDCARVSHEVSALLDAADPIPSAYTLEVSSPGLDRVLRTPAHFERFVGERVRVELKVARDGRRRYTGRLDTVGAVGVEMTVDGAAVMLPFAEIGRARLVPAWGDAPKPGSGPR